MAKIRQQGANTVEYERISSDPFTLTLEKVAVTNAENDTLFFIPDRTGQLVAFPCNKCHTKALSRMVTRDPLAKKAHWDIRLNHVTGEELACTTCHSRDNVEYLTLINNKQIDYNKSQQVCAQCHATQNKDWLGGAHGKTLGGWAPPRVSATCVNCHNPHTPALEARWPARLNTVKIQELDPK